jgi:hypothetical protein
MLHVVGARDHHLLHAVPDEVDETHEHASSALRCETPAYGSFMRIILLPWHSNAQRLSRARNA